MPPWYLIKMKKELSKLILKSKQGTLFLQLKVHDTGEGLRRQMLE
jgi:hypothetical protein